jgi:molybdopterin-guanine dinucleotide biosynthesis protein B
MKAFSVYGYSESGKTTTIECIIRELRKRRYSVGSIKDIFSKDFQIDQKGKDSFRHREAGSQLVTARGLGETAILYQHKLSIPEILGHYDQDYVVCEGETEYNMPRILTGRTTEDLDQRWGPGIFAISGRISETLCEYRGIPVINALSECGRLADLIEKSVDVWLPEVDEASFISL